MKENKRKQRNPTEKMKQKEKWKTRKRKIEKPKRTLIQKRANVGKENNTHKAIRQKDLRKKMKQKEKPNN